MSLRARLRSRSLVRRPAVAPVRRLSDQRRNRAAARSGARAAGL